jgi:tetratricopeptide (TPR) repeat protein
MNAYLSALVVDPHATPAMLAVARLETGKARDEMYARIIREESSPSETLKGVPEAVNPDFAWARYYFGEKYLQEGNKEAARDEFKRAIDRLERRKSYQTYITALQETGVLDPAQESQLDKLLDDCRDGLGKAMQNAK